MGPNTNASNAKTQNAQAQERKSLWGSSFRELKEIQPFRREKDSDLGAWDRQGLESQLSKLWEPFNFSALVSSAAKEQGGIVSW